MENYEGFIDYYKILGVDRNASEEEIKAAYRAMAKKYHPDRNPGDDEAARIMQQVNAAYDEIGNESKNNNRVQYNRKYDQYYAQKRAQEAERARRQQETEWQRQQRAQEAERQRQQRSQQSSQRGSQSGQTQYKRAASRSGYHGNDSSSKRSSQTGAKHTQSGFKSAFADIRTAWKEVREEEKKMPFLKRHRKINGEIYRNMYKENGNGFDDFIYIIKNGSIHVAMETLWQLEKLTHITEDSIPKYVIRNRALAYALVLTMIFSGAIAKTNDNVSTPTNGTSISQQKQEENTGDIEIDDGTYQEEQQRQEEAKAERDYVVTRTYVVQPGDFLSVLAVDANTSVEEIMRLNNIESADHIKYGTTLYIPYVIDGEDLKYATVAAYYAPGTDINEFAKKYGTDAASIYALNYEAYEDGKPISDTLLVPTWASQSEIKEQKDTQAKTYTYGNNQ